MSTETTDREPDVEEAVREAKKALNKTIPAGGGVEWEANRWRCSYCGQSDRGPGEIDHDEDCPFTVERRLRDRIAALDSGEDEGEGRYGRDGRETGNSEWDAPAYGGPSSPGECICHYEPVDSEGQQKYIRVEAVGCPKHDPPPVHAGEPEDVGEQDDPYGGDEACPTMTCDKGWGHEGECEAPDHVDPADDQPDVDGVGEDTVHPYDVLYAAVWRAAYKYLAHHKDDCAGCRREQEKLFRILDEHSPHWHEENDDE